MTKNSDTSPWMRFPDNPKAIKRHNDLVLSSIPTADLVAELSKRDGVGYHIIRNSFEIKRGTCESPKLESHWQEVKYDGPITVLVVRE